MKKIFLILQGIILTISLFGRTEIGIGVVLIDFDESTVVEFYASPDNGLNPVRKITFYDDHVNQVWKIKNYETNKSWLNPESYHPLYDLLSFRCLEKTDGWMKVIVNNSTGLSYWIKATETTIFTDWLTYLKKGQCIKRDKPEIPILELPEDNANIIQFRGKECFQIKTMKDEWIEILLPDETETVQEVSSQKSGWMRWKSGNEMKIKYVIGT